LHGDAPAALEDFEAAARLGAEPASVVLARARLFRDLGWWEAADALLDPFVEAHPDHAPVRLSRAEVRYARGRFGEAAEDYAAALPRLERVLPEHYLQLARALEAQGVEGRRAAVASLDAGLARLGQVPALQLLAIELEVALGRTERALGRLDELAARSPRKEHWLARRGDLLADVGRAAEACDAYRRALAALDALPPHRRSTAAVHGLETRVRARIAALQNGPAPPVEPRRHR
jgi:tetratricopeptide (TPR) repeat protein